MTTAVQGETMIVAVTDTATARVIAAAQAACDMVSHQVVVVANMARLEETKWVDVVWT